MNDIRYLQKLQNAIVDGLLEIKAQEIQIYNTSQKTTLFDRVIIASGNSNRQLLALSDSVVERLSYDRFPRPRVEGNNQSEWILVDCYQVIVHLMLWPARQFYELDKLWGQVPIKLKKLDASSVQT
ncbi:MAG: ribosome silencing factor [Gammaproteobacteria bacterium]|nr:ribosome silencing factor [Gammaproteobacteria bacterium]